MPAPRTDIGVDKVAAEAIPAVILLGLEKMQSPPPAAGPPLLRIGPEAPPAPGPVAAVKAMDIVAGVPPSPVLMPVLVGSPPSAQDDPLIGSPRDRGVPHNPRTVVPAPVPASHAVPRAAALDAAPFMPLPKVVTPSVAARPPIAVVLVLPDVLIPRGRVVRP